MSAVLRLRGTDAEFGRLIEFAEKFAARHGLAAPERARLLIILEELFTNAVRYGYPQGGEEGRIEVELAAAPGQIAIDFSDDGRPFDPLKHDLPALDHLPQERSGGGVGLRIVRSLVNEARYSRNAGRNRLRLVRRLASDR